MPFCWLLVADYPWSEYRWFWVIRWPVLPGLGVLPLVRPLGVETTAGETIAMGLMTLALATIATGLARRSRCWLVGVCSVLAIYGVWMLFASHAVFRA